MDSINHRDETRDTKMIQSFKTAEKWYDKHKPVGGGIPKWIERMKDPSVNNYDGEIPIEKCNCRKNYIRLSFMELSNIMEEYKSLNKNQNEKKAFLRSNNYYCCITAEFNYRELKRA